MIVRGMLAGNPPDLILQRALTGLLAGLVLGAVLGWIGKVVMMENLPVRESEPATEDGSDNEKTVLKFTYMNT